MHSVFFIMNNIFKEVKLFDDNVSDLEMLNNILDGMGNDDPLHILDLGDVLKKHRTWKQKMPRVIPYYAVKCNPNVNVIKLLAMLDGHFDCASKDEIAEVMGLGVTSERIIFANAIKFPTHVEYAKKVGVDTMTVDHESELKKIKEIFPKARILIRIRCDAKITNVALGKKFGCESGTEAVNLIKSTMQLDLELVGFSFHTGSPCGEVDAICRGIRMCNDLIHIARSLGCNTANVIDIGGGIPGERGFDLDEFAGPINAALDSLDSSIKIIAEPGRYYVTSAGSAAARIIGKKVIPKGSERTFTYYMSDGVHGTFFEEIMGHETRHPIIIDAARNVDQKKYISTIWGPTCNSNDCVLKDEVLPEYHVGDWLVWYNVGSYASCFAQNFNGFKPPKVYPVMRRADWESMWADVKKLLDEVTRD